LRYKYGQLEDAGKLERGRNFELGIQPVVADARGDAVGISWWMDAVCISWWSDAVCISWCLDTFKIIQAKSDDLIQYHI
jgi:hypothetical protein